MQNDSQLDWFERTSDGLNSGLWFENTHQNNQTEYHPTNHATFPVSKFDSPKDDREESVELHIIRFVFFSNDTLFNGKRLLFLPERSFAHSFFIISSA